MTGLNKLYLFLTEEFSYLILQFIYYEKKEASILRICLVSFEYPLEITHGGIGTYTYYLSHALARKGHEVHVVTISRDYRRNYVDKDVNVYALKHRQLIRTEGFWNYLIHSFDVYKAVKQLIKRNSIEIVECPTGYVEGFILSQFKVLPVIVKCHGLPWLIMPRFAAHGKPLSIMNEQIMAMMQKSMIESADKLTSPSAALSRIISKQYDLRAEVVSNGIDLQEFNEVKDPSSFRQQYSIGESNPVILYLGRFSKIKGIEILVRTIPRVLEAFPEAFFVFVGRDKPKTRETTYQQWIRQTLGKSQRKNVIFTGYLDGVRKIRAIQASNFLVVPSTWETFPYVCLEAMACGKPVIGSKVGGMKEIINHGENGFMFAPHSDSELAGYIKCLLNDDLKRRKMGELARRTVEKKFSYEIMADKTIQLYREVVESK